MWDLCAVAEAIFLTDTPEMIEKKIQNYAFSGPQHGGVPHVLRSQTHACHMQLITVIEYN